MILSLSVAFFVSSEQTIDKGILHHSGEHKEHTHAHPDVYSFRVGHSRDGDLRSRQLGGHREHCGHSYRDPGRDGVHIDPE